jgi:glutamate dehydrogenase
MIEAAGARLRGQIQRDVRRRRAEAEGNLAWLLAHMPPYFFVTMREHPSLLADLALELPRVIEERRVVLLEQEQRLVLARLNLPGSVYDTLRTLEEREISYAELNRSSAPVPGAAHELEVQHFEFERKGSGDVVGSSGNPVPGHLVRGVRAAVARAYPDFDLGGLRADLDLLWRNNPSYVRLSPPERVARALWLYRQARRNQGLFLDVEAPEALLGRGESRLLFAVGNPPQGDFLVQVMEVFHRLGLGVRRLYCLTIHTGLHPYFLGNFYVAYRDGRQVIKGTQAFEDLRSELYNTQILSTNTPSYTNFVSEGRLSGPEAALLDAFIAFCHTTLAHTRPDAFGLEDVMRAFHSHPDLSVTLVRLFQTRFDPDLADRGPAYDQALADAEAALAGYNTGHRFLDEFRRKIFRTALTFIRHCLKTNFFVPEKHALAFRLDPAYLEDLDPEFVADLPPERPFRVTFFCGRRGVGYHIGFSDIARGGWRTVVSHSRDDYVTNANPLFREAFVLAHTQHLKNKDIYEGGSKLVAVLDAGGLKTPEEVTQRLYKLQYGLLNAFLDVFVTDGGVARHPRVVDYYRQDEPIELGPDENLHDEMIEWIAQTSERRGYLLGKGIISSKRIGINHKQYGVTSTGVVAFAEVTLAELGIDLRKDPFTVKFTGGPNGDVAGNALRLLLERCPRVQVNLIVDGSGLLCVPKGADREALSRIVLRADVESFDPEALGPGGFLLYRNRRRQEGLRELFRKLVRTPDGLVEEWVTTDEFHRDFEGLVFSVASDLFLPAGGRPETIDARNWRRLFQEDGTPTCRAIVEGANSFLSPEARVELQKRGIIVIRDASANKCGVISSSYEIIANLLLTDREFLAHKEEYVADVLAILDKRARDEAQLIFRRHREGAGKQLCTEISTDLSQEINGHYQRLFDFFQRRPELGDGGVFRRALLEHLPRMIREHPRFRTRVKRLPPKYRAAILASEVASRIVYRGGWEPDLDGSLRTFLERTLGA